MTKGKRWVLGLLILAAQVEFVAYLGRDSHHANIPYNLWKVHLVAYENAKPFRYIYVDPYFRNFLSGKTRAEIETWFPDLRQSTAQEDDKKAYEDGLLKHYPNSQIYWSGLRHAFIFNDDRFVDIRICKG